MCGANCDLLLSCQSFWYLCNVFWLQLRQDKDSSWDLGTPSRWHHNNLRTICHVNTYMSLGFVTSTSSGQKAVTDIKETFIISCPEFISKWIMCGWEDRENLGAIFYHFTTLFDDPCFKRHPALTTKIALINFWQMIYVQLLLSGITLWISFVFFRVFVFVLDCGLLVNDQWWCLKKENSLPFDRWSISIHQCLLLLTLVKMLPAWQHNSYFKW